MKKIVSILSALAVLSVPVTNSAFAEDSSEQYLSVTCGYNLHYDVFVETAEGPISYEGSEGSGLTSDGSFINGTYSGNISSGKTTIHTYTHKQNTAEGSSLSYQAVHDGIEDTFMLCGTSTAEYDAGGVAISYIGDSSENIFDDPFASYSFTRIFPQESANCNITMEGRSQGTVNVKYLGRHGYIAVSDSGTLRANFIVQNKAISVAQVFRVTSVNPICFKFNEQFNDWELYCELPGGDGTFSTHVERGDVNCDGSINAADASLVLESYAYLSTKDDDKVYVDLWRGDFNDDGKINAADASDILKYYADQSTQS